MVPTKLGCCRDFFLGGGGGGSWGSELIYAKFWHEIFSNQVSILETNTGTPGNTDE